jgi:hypothetical protein
MNYTTKLSKTFIYVIAVILALVFVACEFEHKQNGYPSKVLFYSNGGSQVISGNVPFRGIEIATATSKITVRAYDGYTQASDSCEISYDWLTVKCKKGQSNIELIAEPSVSEKRRKLLVIGYNDPEYAEIEVSQDGVKRNASGIR